jgi:hypothetical protein
MCPVSVGMTSSSARCRVGELPASLRFRDQNLTVCSLPAARLNPGSQLYEAKCACESTIETSSLLRLGAPAISPCHGVGFDARVPSVCWRKCGEQRRQETSAVTPPGSTIFRQRIFSTDRQPASSGQTAASVESSWSAIYGRGVVSDNHNAITLVHRA